MAHRLASTALPIALLSTIALVGCDAPGFKTKVKSPSPLAQQQQPASETTTTSASMPGMFPPGTKQNPAVYTPGLTVSDAIAQACGIAPRAAPGGAGKAVAPSFDFDSASLADADRQMLGEVAKCLTEGALKGRAVSLVGRADARGESEYNMTLGESRATSVQRYLVELGVGKPRLRPTSRGEMDATGTNEEGWAQDRRVDIELVL